MPSALETLVKILKLERDQGYKNTAVIGGLGAFSDKWQDDAHIQARIEMHHLMVDDLAQLMERYDVLENKSERHEVISYMLDRVMMRITEPRADFVPRGNWADLQHESPPPKSKKTLQSKASSVSSPKREVRPARASKFSLSNRSESSDELVFRSDLNDEFDSPDSGLVGSDVVNEVHLERPPRQPRRNQSAEESADIMRGLRASVSNIKGVGKRLMETLARLDIHTVEDLLFHLPRRYDDYTQLLPLSKLEPESVVTVIGTVRNTHVRASYGGRKDFAFTLDDGTGTLMVTFFGQQWMRQKVRDGLQMVLSGKVSIYRNQLQMTNPDWEPLEQENLHTRGIIPVYRLTEGLNEKRFRKLMHEAVHFWSERLPDYVPESVLERTDLADIGWMLKNIHFPEGHDHLVHARRRFVFDELLLLQLAIMQNRREWQSVEATPLEVADDWLETFLQDVFPYELTGAQRRAVDDIRKDIARDLPMNRLIQGDVGSGKTAIAITAMAVAFVNDKQTALMAPTSILAEQHYRGISESLEKIPGSMKPTVALLTGSLPKSERDTVYAGLADGSIDVVIGTHALIQGGLEFYNLGLIVVDEQHRFGVEQRGTLRGKGTNPHLLVMTATPIPRTLALTMYADLDLSVVDEMPPGRTPIKTTVRAPIEREHCYDFIEAQLSAGRQAFIVHPLVEASEKLDAPSAVEAYEQLKDVFYQYNVGLLHGKMKSAEKDEIMHDFAKGDYDVLVTTSVAEVGVNVPNASVMMIEGANRFGLSQLHQFRGRVGRGIHPGYCLLIPDKFTEASEERLAAMVETTDGFKLGEIDWRARGAGDLLGTRQSGANKLQLQEEMNPELVQLANKEARTIYAEDPDLSLDDYRLLRQRVEQMLDVRSDIS